MKILDRKLHVLKIQDIILRILNDFDHELDAHRSQKIKSID